MKKRKYIPFNLLKIELKITSQKRKKFEGNEREKQNFEKKQTKKWTERAVAGIYSVFFLTESSKGI